MPLPSLRTLSLKTRIALAMAGVFIGCISTLAVLGLRYFENEFRNHLYQQQFELVSSLAANLDDKLRISQDALVARAGQFPRKVLTDPDRAQRYLDGRAPLRSIFDNGLFLISREGRIIAESPNKENRRGRDVSFREFFQVTARTQQPYISKPYTSTYSPGQPALMLTAPLLDEHGSFIGLLAGSFNLMGQNVLADLNKVKIGKTGYVFIADDSRLMITHGDPRRIMKPTDQPGQDPLFDQALAGFEGSGRTVTSFGGEMYSSFKRLAATDWILAANYPVAEAEAPLYKARNYFFLALGLGTLVVLAMTWLVVKRLMAPLADLTRHVQELSQKTGAERRLTLPAGGEIGSLVHAFNGMVQTLDQQQHTLQASEARFRSLAEMSSDWYWEQGPDFRFSLMSQGVSPISISSTLGKTRWELPIEDVSDAQWEDHRKQLERHEPFKDFAYQIQSASGGVHTFMVSGSPFFGSNGEFLGYRGIGTDITERINAEKKIEFLAYHDALTGLPNRLLAQDRFEQAVAQGERDNTKVALLYLDLDNFKTINDTLGHATGDQLLKEIARRLGECMRDTDTLCRQGGDEFLIVLRDLPDIEVVSEILLKIMDRLKAPIHAEELELSTSASIGVAVCPDDGRDFESLCKKADLAMYRSKDAGRNAYHFFDQAMDTEAAEHLLLRNGLRRALERNEFSLHYQPQFDLVSGEVIGVEALLRWNSPELGPVPPARFIPVAEESGLIVPMGAWVLREACAQAVAWSQAGLAALTMAVNLSAMQFKRGDVEQSVLRALADSGLAPELLELELTESILIQNAEGVLASLKRLKQIGVKLSIDDFGTGYSSLAYLKRFDIDKLKIDQSFVRDLATDPDDAAIVRAIIQMARSLNLRTIAEGVETLEMLQQLRIFECDEVQGYYFARPMPAQDLERYLAGNRQA